MSLQSEEIDITPLTEMLDAWRDVNLGWPLALGELIDNAFDAGAMNIRIQFVSSRQLVVEDDGCGCSDPKAMLRFGHHERKTTTRLGRFGVGLKKVACWLWGEMSVRSVVGDQCYIFAITWDELKRKGEWKVRRGAVVASNGEIGTRLRFTRISRVIPKGDYQRLVDELSFLFTPGLLKGAQIRFEFPRRKPLLATSYQMPPLEDVIEDEFAVNGRGVRLRAGIVKEGHKNLKAGFTYCHHHRVIMATTWGAKQYSVRRVAGQVFLDDAWKLTVHKDDISQHKDELEDAVFKRCESMLKKAEQQAEHIASVAFTKDLTEQLRAALLQAAKTKKARRKPPQNQTGAIQPKGTSRTHKQAKRKQPGERMLDDEYLGRLRIDWKPCEGETLGEIDKHGPVVWFNENNVYLTRLRREENRGGLLVAAIGMYVGTAVMSDDPQMFFPGWQNEVSDPRYCELWARVLNSIDDKKEEPCPVKPPN